MKNSLITPRFRVLSQKFKIQVREIGVLSIPFDISAREIGVLSVTFK